MRGLRHKHANIIKTKRFYSRPTINVNRFQASTAQDNVIAAENKKPALKFSTKKFRSRNNNANKKNINDFFLTKLIRRSKFHSSATPSLPPESLTTTSQKRHYKNRRQQKVCAAAAAREFSSTALPLDSHPGWDQERPYKNYDDETLYLLCKAFHVPKIQEERMRREIMDVDECDATQANLVLAEMTGLLLSRVSAYSFPYVIGLACIGGSMIASIPLVFSKRCAMWFNDAYVTQDVPPADDIETMLEVGAWTWNWMEPPLGTASFCILGAQYCKSYMVKLGVAPYQVYFESQNVIVLQEKYPGYDLSTVKDFVDSKQFFSDAEKNK